MKGVLIVLFVVFSVVTFSQKKYDRKTTSSQQVEYYKSASVEDLQKILSKTASDDPAKPLIEALIDQKSKLSTGSLKPKKSGNGSGYGYNPKPVTTTSSSKDTTLVSVLKGLLEGQKALQEKIKNLEDKINGVDSRLEDLEASINKKIDELAIQIVTANNTYVSSVEKAVQINDADKYLQNGYVLFSSDSHLGLKNSPEEVRQWALVLKQIAGVHTFDPDWFREFMDTKTVSDPLGLKIVKASLMILGLRVEPDNLDYYDEYFFENQRSNSADIKELFWRFYKLQE